MGSFPRTEVGGISLSRMVIGTNWFLGYSHVSAAKSQFITQFQTVDNLASILEVFLEFDINAMVGLLDQHPILVDAIKEAQQRTGKELIVLDTPALPMVDGMLDVDGVARTLDRSRECGARFCMPHQSTTDMLIDYGTRTVRQMDEVCAMIRERGMIPGLSSHRPEIPGYSDASGLDVETYIQMYNAAGFMMPVEVDWAHRVIWGAAKPVLCIKPLAAGGLLPLVGLAFVWSTLRDKDMVAIGTLTPGEAREDIEISLSLLERRAPQVELQTTRSKSTLEKD